MSRIVIVGGGVIGAACAWYLCRHGGQVTILEKDTFGRGCSHGNCGFICPSHVLPLATPGAIGAALRALWQSNGPLRIKLGLDVKLWYWFWQFTRRCNYQDMAHTAVALHSLLQASRKLYDELLAMAGPACDWQTRGLLMVFKSPRQFAHHARVASWLGREFGVLSEAWTAPDLQSREPALKTGLAGGWFYPEDAHLRPDLLLSWWHGRLLAAGVHIYEHCPAVGLVQRGGKVVAVETEAGSVPAEIVVITSGAWTPLLGRLLGANIPIQPGKGYSLTMVRPRTCPLRPLLFEEHRVAVTPFTDCFRLGSTMEFCGYDPSLPRQRLDYLRAAAKLYLHEADAEPVIEEWYGWRPMTFDGLPIIDHLPRLRNVWIAGGHGMLGMTLAPASGQLLAERIFSLTPHIDPAPYRLSRFHS
jgi:D-amino-acid dehydrogenase